MGARACQLASRKVRSPTAASSSPHTCDLAFSDLSQPAAHTHSSLDVFHDHDEAVATPFEFSDPPGNLSLSSTSGPVLGGTILRLATSHVDGNLSLVTQDPRTSTLPCMHTVDGSAVDSAMVSRLTNAASMWWSASSLSPPPPGLTALADAPFLSAAAVGRQLGRIRRVDAPPVRESGSVCWDIRWGYQGLLSSFFPAIKGGG